MLKPDSYSADLYQLNPCGVARPGLNSLNARGGLEMKMIEPGEIFSFVTRSALPRLGHFDDRNIEIDPARVLCHVSTRQDGLC